MKKVSKQDILMGIKLMDADERAELDEGCKELLATVDAADGPVNIITDIPLVGTVQFFVDDGKLMASAGKALYEMTSFPYLSV